MINNIRIKYILPKTQGTIGKKKKKKSKGLMRLF
jgi:hypothetical protein